MCRQRLDSRLVDCSSAYDLARARRAAKEHGVKDLGAVVERWFELLNAHDLAGLADLYAADCEYVRSNGTSHGPAEVAAYFAAIADSFPDHAARVEAMLIGDSAVTVEWTETGTHTEDYRSGTGEVIVATGKSFEARIVDVIRFDGELITSQHEYFDRLDFLTQIGWL